MNALRRDVSKRKVKQRNYHRRENLDKSRSELCTTHEWKMTLLSRNKQEMKLIIPEKFLIFRKNLWIGNFTLFYSFVNFFIDINLPSKSF